MSNPIAVVTGASSGIGHATAVRLAAEGFHVVATARRTDRIEELAARIGGTAVPCDITVDADVTALVAAVEQLPGEVKLLVNNAGGAIGLEPVAEADVADWQRMYDINVLGTLRVTKGLLPHLTRGHGDIVVISSTAGLATYEGGGGYAAAKHAETVLAQTLRLELCGTPVRIMEINPGMVKTEEFSTVRFRGDQAAADKVYEGVAEPLLATDIADCVAWVATRPHHVNIDRMVVRPLAQAANHKVDRRPKA
ncbi:NADP-dependent 3-hydroxy acid dehydrogenase YdfG [Stackebrandtia endophytica]|uniref:NADP-dependent 3-hydroxy acid dehydrogenase YdfG n=1 Tax=Stackebrandtia endophytica TaxID=1496996 RepID=A0A543AZF8_9ACTN|nr:SDR family oxidoreductase [Stackebrandtia endophytica]TQL77951.1 NADP-dependent 3-hydroxy acid dehydrogenase YdfG [Stackebrandtia endophytica]